MNEETFDFLAECYDYHNEEFPCDCEDCRNFRQLLKDRQRNDAGTIDIFNL
jgi:hypothetical protein